MPQIPIPEIEARSKDALVRHGAADWIAAADQQHHGVQSDHSVGEAGERESAVGGRQQHRRNHHRRRFQQPGDAVLRSDD